MKNYQRLLKWIMLLRAERKLWLKYPTRQH